MVDPDAPSRATPTMREFLHWLVVNVHGDDLRMGDTLAPYVGVGAPERTGLHRFVFLVYRQPGRISDPELETKLENVIDGRVGFNCIEFARKHHLGQPTHGNLFQAQYDKSVPRQHAKLLKYAADHGQTDTTNKKSVLYYLAQTQ